jgi:ADP-heptose:LPS heptosyltransferase
MNILIVRLGALGDVVHAVPAAAALREAFPGAGIDWLVDAKHREIVDLVTAIDRTVTLDSPSLSGWTAVLRELRRTAYDVAIDLQGLLKSAVLARGSGATRIIGFSIWHLREKTARPFYSDVLEAEGGHVIAQNLRLLRAIG